MPSDCIFCKIIKAEIPANFLHKDEDCVAFHDLYKKARVHVLIVPKKHIKTVFAVQPTEKKLIGHLIWIANMIAKQEKLAGYKLIFNVGKEGGQEIFHLHLHLLGQ